MKKLAVLFVTISLFAATPAGFKMWKAMDLKAMPKTTLMGDYGNHNLTMTFRDKSGMVEVHRDWTDIIIIESGRASMSIGGTPVDPKPTKDGEIRADTASGAEKMAVEPGDVLNIAAGVPHQFILEPGAKVGYVAIKVPAK